MTSYVKSALCLWALYGVMIGCSKGDDPAPAGPPPYAGKPINVDEFPNVGGTIYGRWTAEQAEFGNEMAYFTNLYFNKTSIGIAVTCMGFGEEVTVSDTLPAEYAKNSFTILEGVRAVMNGARLRGCSLEVEPMTYGFQLRSNRLELVEKSSEVTRFARLQ